jgi:FNIP Repeat
MLCGTLGALPQALNSLSAPGRRDGAGIAALKRALKTAPSKLRLLNLYMPVNEGLQLQNSDALAGVQCPAGVTKLNLKGVGCCNFTLGPLPDSSEELIVGRGFSQPLGPLPHGLRRLLIGNSEFNHPLGDLPEQLRELQLSYYYFDQQLSPLPQSLERLEMGTMYSHPLSLPLPPHLRLLHVSDRFNHSLGVLPQSLTELKVGAEFNHDLRPLPQSLAVLDLSKARKFDHPLPPLAELPAWLHTLAEERLGQQALA